METYAIAAFLSADQRRRALAGTYPSCATGWCPLGVALQTRAPRPEPVVVATRLWATRRGTGRSQRIEAAACAFMAAWDTGRIPPDQLASALGGEAP